MSRYIAPLLIGVLGTAILVGLGVWQVHRLQWKEALLAEIAARMELDPVALPEHPDPASDRFRPVALHGRVGSELALVFIPQAGGGGVRMRLIRPLELENGRRVLLEIGNAAPEVLDQLETLPRFSGTGILYWPQEVDLFTPGHDAGTNVWYARDLPAMAEELGTEPLLVIASARDLGNPLILSSEPDPSRIANNHLQYAVTWFGLAIVWAGMTVLWLARIRRRRYLER
ncbi:SURF1 family protein [Mangrovicoccus sp. HB161399]|uniref:SURF1 family protein n=1 Tax=Mangrovicoccus sp. HB161399 TaxID=2720392 RepID=UPI0015566566|nr:SURF1 family protein [Mangrovicoccus sp. HB161399]